MWSRYLSSDVFHQLVAPNGQSREGAILKPEKQAIFEPISYDSMMTYDHSIHSIDECILVIKTENAQLIISGVAEVSKTAHEVLDGKF